MALLLFVFLICSVLHGVASTICTTPTYYRISCTWGCCSNSGYPCCSAPFYSGAAFIAPIVIGSIVLFAVILAAIIIVRRRRIATTIHYGVPIAAPHVLATYPVQTASNQYNGYNSTQFNPPPSYSAEPPKY